jgi:hypothetical protein
VTHTASDIPGDPLNIALVGTEEDLIRAMTTARWDPANPLTFRSGVRIVIDSMLRKPDDEAPVSNLYLFGRREDLAFEKPVGNSPRNAITFVSGEWRRTTMGGPLGLGRRLTLSVSS